jgi:fibronectin type 3 domain-containing protein
VLVTGPSSFSFSANPTATSVSVSGLTPGTTYNWQVSAKNNAGESAPASSSFTTLVAPPSSAPAIVSPANGASNVPIEPTLQWSAVAGAKTYTLEVSEKENVRPILFTASRITETSHGVSGLLGETTYYWRVRAENEAGAGPWSATANFKTVSTKPPAPSLVSPSNGATGVSTSPTLEWQEIAGAQSYALEYTTDQQFRQNVTSENVTRARVALRGLNNNTVYYWRVNARTAGGTSDWSSVFHFTTVSAAPTAAPSIVSPASGSTNVPINATLMWTAVTGAKSYSVELSDRQNMNSVLFSATDITATSHGVGGLAGETKYYWRVRAENEGGAGPWSSVANFTTASTKPSAPELVSPTDGAIDVPTTVRFEWRPVVDRISYTVEYSTERELKREVTTLSAATAYIEVSGLANGTKYFWRVNVRTSGGVSDWSPIFNFTTTSGKPPAPTGLLADPGSTKVTLYWNPVIGSVGYDVQVAEDERFTHSRVKGETSVAGTTAVMTGLEADRLYYWRVRAKTASVVGDYSQPQTFRTLKSLAAPELTSPANNSVHQPVTLSLNWKQVTGADSYGVQVASDRQFRQILIDTSGIRVFSYPLSRLSPNANYYWRVNASNAQGTSPWSAEWSFKTASSTLARPVLVFPSNGASSVPLTINLVWRRVAGATQYDVQWSTDNRFADNLHEAKADTSAALIISGLSPKTRYFWRVRARSAVETGEWSNDFLFTTAESHLLRPRLVAPEKGARDVPTNVSLEWMPVPNVTFTLQYDTDQRFGSAVIVRGLSVAFYRINGLLPRQRYYWRVQSQDSLGVSEWSEEYHFTTGASQLVAPALVSPSDRARDVPTNVTLQWSRVAGALWYSIRYTADRQKRDSIIIVEPVEKTQLELKGLSRNTTYFWSVQAKDSANASLWSGWAEFTTGSGQLARVSLLSPPDKQRDIVLNPTLEWSSVHGAVWYQLQISTDRQLRSGVVHVDSIRSTSYGITNLLVNTTYFWRVQAKGVSDVSEWSDVFEFRTGTATLLVPILYLPPNEATGISTEITLSWKLTPGATGYAVQVAEDKNFRRDKVLDESLIRSSTVELKNLKPKTTYYWRVMAKDTIGSSAWSDAWSFTTGSGILATPQLIEPADEKKGESIVPTLSWTNVTGATSYTLHVARDSNFRRELIEVTGISRSSYTLSELAKQETYYWRVRATNGKDSSDWSQVWKFTTGNGPLGVPTLLAPANGRDASLNPTLSWLPSQGATSYKLQVSSQNDLIVDASGVTATSFTVTGLENRKRYTWRVKAVNAREESDWSENWTFTALSTVTSVGVISGEIPVAFLLHQNYPNPFNPATTVQFSLSFESDVRLEIYDVLGNLVSTLIDRRLHAGTYSIVWNASGMPSGVYFSRLHTTDYTATRRLLLLK